MNDFMAIKNPPSKRLFDLIIGTGILFIAAPLMIIVALLIVVEQRCNPIFSQRRTGLGGSEFIIYKFRTMSEPLQDGEKPLFVSASDPYVTRLGRILRNTSIDELPQLFNVLKGDMSIVGPRPQPLNHLSYYGSRIKNYLMRLQMKPGITGLVQITPLRYEVDNIVKHAARVHFDLYYIRHWTLFLDIWICWKTFCLVLNPKMILAQDKYFTKLRAMTALEEQNDIVDKFIVDPHG